MKILKSGGGSHELPDGFSAPPDGTLWFKDPDTGEYLMVCTSDFAVAS